MVDEGGLARDLAGVYRTTLSIRDVEGFVGVRKETKFYSERRLYSLPEYKTLHEEEEERKTRGAYRRP